MIGPVLEFTKEFIKDKSFVKVLEVGSRVVDGGSIKDIIQPHSHEYIGLDLIEGTNVDIVADAENLLQFFAPETFDLVVCCETLEHVKNPVKIVENMRAVLKSGGWMLITTPGTHHPEHGWPSDYYRFLANTYRDVFFEGYDNCYIESKSWDNRDLVYPDAILGFGRKP